jgi:hypothetical protein
MAAELVQIPLRPTRHLRWRRAWVWDRLLQVVSEAYDSEIVMID